MNTIGKHITLISTLLLGGCDKYHFEEELHTTLNYDTVAVTTKAIPKSIIHYKSGGNWYTSDPDTSYRIQITGSRNPDNNFISDSDDKLGQLLGDHNARELYHLLHGSDSAIVDHVEFIEQTYKNGILIKETIKKDKFTFRPYRAQNSSP